MKLISFQPYSLYDAGGGSRILRRLYSGNEKNVLSIGIKLSEGETKTSSVKEIMVSAFPIHKKWMRSYLRRFFSWLREDVFFRMTLKKLQNATKNVEADILHIVDHGKYSEAFFALENKFKIWTSFHDHFLTAGGNYNISKRLWNISERRLVISNEMGLEYQKLFGNKPFEMITDGVDENEISAPRAIPDSNSLNVYFAGLLHIDYLPLFEVLADALDELSIKKQIKFVLRGTQQVDFLLNRKFQVDFLPVTMDSNTLKSELDAADILYLPIKFTVPEFYKYSLSTKMIGYLGGAGAILYHGPEDSAACGLLNLNDAAVTCTTLNKDDILEALNEIFISGFKKSVNAKLLARNKFLLKNIRKKIWG